jgi:hypothetical protein
LNSLPNSISIGNSLFCEIQSSLPLIKCIIFAKRGKATIEAYVVKRRPLSCDMPCNLQKSFTNLFSKIDH